MGIDRSRQPGGDEASRLEAWENAISNKETRAQAVRRDIDNGMPRVL